MLPSKKMSSQHHSPRDPRDALHSYHHSHRHGSSYDLRKSNRLVLTKVQSNASSSTDLDFNLKLPSLEDTRNEMKQLKLKEQDVGKP
jgi:hypothetical protein